MNFKMQMNIKRKNKSSYKIEILIGAIIFFAVFLVFYNAKAVSISSIASGKCDDIDECNEQAAVVRQSIEIKEKQGELLNNQLELTNANIQQVENQIDLSTQQIDDLNSQIIRLGKQIEEKNSVIESQKKMLGRIVQSYYEANQTGLLAAYLSGGNLASFIVKKDRIAQTGDKIKELVDSIIETRKKLEEESAELDNKKGEVIEKNQNLQNQNENLVSIKQQKQTLLDQTQGEEERYRELLKKIEAQKQELLDIDEFYADSGLSADSYDKPDSKYFASTGWYYSQKDSDWGNDNIGNTKTKMKNYGCAVTSVAMVFKEHGVSMDPGRLANEPIFSGDLINWYDSKDWKKNWPVPDSHGWSHGNVSWSVIDSKIDKDIPVIVYIKRSKGGGHYVVIHHKVDTGKNKGKYVVHDPYFGANIFLDTSRALVGAMGSSSSTSINQMIIYN